MRQAVAQFRTDLLPRRQAKAAPPPAALPTLWVGAVTPTAAVVKAWVARDSPARLRVAPTASPEQAIEIEARPGTSGAREIRTFDVHQLVPDTAYTYTVATDDGRMPPGEFRTFPATAASFQFAFSSCAQTGSSHPVFSTLLKKKPLFFLHLGDLHYQNIARNDPALFRAAWRQVLGSPAQAALYRNVPLAYVWDDHDFGPNGSDRTSPSRAAARLAYQEFMPHYPLIEGVGNVPIYQAFSVGRVRFLITDLRSERSPENASDDRSKTMMGAAQKAWFKQEVLEAQRNATGLIVWVCVVPFVGRQRKGDGWARYSTERREIADFLKANKIRNLVVLSGDAHMCAADDGTNADYATGGGAPLRVMHGSSLDKASSFKGGPYSHGFYRPRSDEGCFGWVEVNDSGSGIEVSFTGRTHFDVTKIRMQFRVPA